MFYPNDYILTNIKKQQVKEYLREAERDHLVARLKSPRPNPLIQLARAALQCGGQLLAAVSRRLEHTQLPPPSVHVGNAAPSK